MMINDLKINMENTNDYLDKAILLIKHVQENYNTINNSNNFSGNALLCKENQDILQEVNNFIMFAEYTYEDAMDYFYYEIAKKSINDILNK